MELAPCSPGIYCSSSLHLSAFCQVSAGNTTLRVQVAAGKGDPLRSQGRSILAPLLLHNPVYQGELVNRFQMGQVKRMSAVLWRSEFRRSPWVGGKLGSEELVVKGTNLHPSAEKGNVPHHRGSSSCFESNQKRHKQTRTLHLPSSFPLLPNKLAPVRWPLGKTICICRTAVKHHSLWSQTQGKLRSM